MSSTHIIYYFTKNAVIVKCQVTFNSRVNLPRFWERPVSVAFVPLLNLEHVIAMVKLFLCETYRRKWEKNFF
jgi:hypothetical protein